MPENGRWYSACFVIYGLLVCVCVGMLDGVEVWASGTRCPAGTRPPQGNWWVSQGWRGNVAAQGGPSGRRGPRVLNCNPLSCLLHTLAVLLRGSANFWRRTERARSKCAAAAEWKQGVNSIWLNTDGCPTQTGSTCNTSNCWFFAALLFWGHKTL